VRAVIGRDVRMEMDEEAAEEIRTSGG